ncbi:MAG TPA: peptidyl-alpha-hydroxyglycine alpha-amidating lyase family protein [Bryobacteraceae bacterium]|nr:peptidyl-alpha-hydroxyglycine alpha-amidating lyase family protein [Bryobacteraceae bacterium]
MDHRRTGLLLSILAAAISANAQPDPYRLVEHWFQLPDGRAMGSTNAIDIDSKGHIWVFERCGAGNCVGKTVDPILEFDESGKLLTSFGGGMFVFPHGLAIDGDDNVWVTDAQARNGMGNQVFKFGPDGKVLMKLGKAGVAGSGPDEFNQPNDVAIAADGAIFVAEGHGAKNANNRVTKFTKDGKFIKSWGKTGSAAGEFDVPHALAFDSQGRLFVGDRNNNRIQIFDQDGNFIAEWKQFGRPSGIFISRDDTIYVADSDSNTARNPGFQRGVRVGSARTGKLTALIPDTADADSNERWPGNGIMISVSSGPEGVAADARGNIYTAEVGPMDVKKYVRK